MTPELATLIAATVAAVASLVGVAFNAWAIRSRIRRDSLAAVAAQRVQWIERLRTATADVVAHTHCLMDRDGAEIKGSEEFKQFLIKFNYLTLMFNDRELKNLHENLVSICKMDDTTITALDQLVDRIREIVKVEWDRSKQELRGISNAS